MKCRVCSKKKFKQIIDLGNQPWGNDFLKKSMVGKEKFYPLKLLYCENCQLVQLNYTVKKEIMFKNHTYLSGTTKTLNNHFNDVALKLDKKFFKNKRNKNAFDIGSNDGTQLKYYKKLGYNVLGVESSAVASRIANKNGIRTINKFFNENIAKKIDNKFDIINASGVFFHLEELHSVTKGIKKLLKKDGIFVVQFIYLKEMIKNLAFDQIYHEHLIYYNLKTLNNLLKMHGLELFHAYKSKIHGGSIIGYVAHHKQRKITKNLIKLIKSENEAKVNNYSTLLRFAKRIENKKLENKKLLANWSKQKKIVYGFGAPVKGNTLMNYFKISNADFKYLVEKNTLRKGLYSPGSHIKIILENEIVQHPDIYYVLAWNFKKEILKNNKYLIKKGVKFYFPINPK